MTRTQNVKRNLVFNIIKFVSQLLLRFILRTALIYVMGAEYIGLNGLFSNIFTFLNLAELGIGSAIIFSMYKPIANGDLEKVKSLQNLYKKFYLIIALVILVVGGILTPFIKIFIKDEVNVNINIYILFLMYLVNSVVGYFSAHKRSLLLAYQRNDIENKINTVCTFILTIIQIAILFLFKNYYAYFAVNIVFTILECVVIHLVANKYYPEINGNAKPLDKDTKKEISKNMAALSLHKIGSAVVFSTDNILISSLFGVVLLGAYSNYTLIISSLGSLFLLLTNALTGSVGNLIASSDKEHIYKKFKQINFIFSFLTAFCSICLFVLFQPFIKVWTGGGDYLLSFSTVTLLCLSFYLTRMRNGVGLFKDCAGLFWQDRWKPIAEAVVNLVVSIILAKFMGINGVFLGTIISTIIAPFWVEPYLLFKHVFKKSSWQYFKRYILDFVITIAVACITFFICSFIPEGGIWLLIARFAVAGVCNITLLVIAYSWSSELKETFILIKKVIGDMFKRNKNK